MKAYNIFGFITAASIVVAIISAIGWIWSNDKEFWEKMIMSCAVLAFPSAYVFLKFMVDEK